MKTRTLGSLSALFFAALAVGTAALPSAAHAQKAAHHISYVPVDYVGAATTTEVNGINDYGDFVGAYDDAQGNFHGFTGKVGSTLYTPIDFPNSTQTYVVRINNRGEMVGTYFDKAGIQHGYFRLPARRNRPEQFISFDFPGVTPTTQYDFELGTGLGTSAYGLNDRGEITGQYADDAGVGHGFLLSNGNFTSYTPSQANSTPGFYGGSGLSDINNKGELTGGYASSDPNDPIIAHGFVLSNGHMTVIDPPGSILTQTFTINSRQEVCGFYYDAQRIGHGYIYHNGKYQIIDVPGAVYLSTVGTVNNGSEFVGEFVDGAGITHGYVATRH